MGARRSRTYGGQGQSRRKTARFSAPENRSNSTRRYPHAAQPAGCPNREIRPAQRKRHRVAGRLDLRTVRLAKLDHRTRSAGRRAGRPCREQAATLIGLQGDPVDVSVGERDREKIGDHVQVARLDRPSGNITGFANLEASMGGKWLELLSEIAPGLKRTAVMFNPDTAPAPTYMPSLETAAQSLKVVPIIAPVHDDAEIETAITALGREPGIGLVVLPGVFTVAHRAPIISAAARSNVPAVYSQSAFAREGGLLSYGPDRIDTFRRAATYVDRILRGEKPGDLPVQFPTKFEMVVNRKTATALGLEVPLSIRLRADEVIE